MKSAHIAGRATRRAAFDVPGRPIPSTVGFKTIVGFLHLYLGLAAAPLLLVLGVTGSILSFEYPLDRALNPGLNYVTPAPKRVSLDRLAEAAHALDPAARLATLSLSPYSSAPDIAYTASLVRADSPAVTVYLDPYTGDVLGEHTGPTFTSRVHNLHTNLLTGEDAWGSTLLALTAALLILLSLTGIILWWPRKVLRVNWRASFRRITFDLHNALGFCSFLFLLLFGVTGVIVRMVPVLIPSPASASAIRDNEPQLQTRCPAGQPPRATLEDVAAASASTRGARLTQIGFPQGRGVYRIWMKYPEDHTPLGRTSLLIDPCDAAVLWSRTSRTAAPSTRFLRQWNHELHTGDFFGIAGKIIFCLMSLTLPILAVSGPLFWLRRQIR